MKIRSKTGWSMRLSEEHQDEQEAIGRGRDHEEIGRHNLADVIPQERAPGLGRRLVVATHVFRDGRLTDVDSEFQQFAMNPRRAPARVRLRHRANPPNGRRSTGIVGRPMRRRLFPAHHSRKPRRCQAMTRGAGGGASRTSARDGTRSRGRPRPCRTAAQGRRAWRSGRAGTRARSPCPDRPDFGWGQSMG
jgi:hypothetical protein